MRASAAHARMEERSTVFISDSHHDVRWKDRLVDHLQPLAQQGLVDVWDDSRITARAPRIEN
jgi:hypothetical protein